MIYHLFGMLWTVNFLAGISMMAISGTICAWYFSKPAHDAQGNLVEGEKYDGGSGSHLCAALSRTLRYYLGSVAVGSFLIAVVQMVRLAFAYLQNKLKDQAQKNMALKFLLYCVQCLLACLEALVKVVTRNSFIFIQLKGDSFCGAGSRVFMLIVKHGEKGLGPRSAAPWPRRGGAACSKCYGRAQLTTYLPKPFPRARHSPRQARSLRS